MEDKTVVYGSFRNKKDEDYFAVFDGHSGTAASIFASKVLSEDFQFTDPRSIYTRSLNAD